jgi:hypothetical protein
MTFFNKSRPCSYLCNSMGKTLYTQLTDRLFDVPAEWNHRECQNPRRGLIWLAPCPIDAHTGNLYESYNTYQQRGKSLIATTPDPVTFRMFRQLYHLLEHVLLL